MRAGGASRGARCLPARGIDLPDTSVATTPVRDEAPAPTRTPAAPDSPTPELATEAAAAAAVRALHPGAGGSAAAGGNAGPPGTPSVAQRTSRVRAGDLVALQRVAGNRAVQRLVSRRPPTQAGNGAAPSSTIVRPAVQRDTTAPGTETLPPPANQKDENKPDDPANQAQAMVVRSDTAAQAALDFKAWAAQLVDEKTKTPLKFVIITLEPKAMNIYNRDGGLLDGPIELALPKGTSFDEGVFVTMPGGGSSMRMRMDPVRHRFRPYENAAILQEIEQKGKAPSGAPGSDKGTDKGTASKTADGDAGAVNAMEPTSKAPKAFDLRKYVKDPSRLDRLAGTFGDAVEFLIVRTPLTDGGGGTGKGGGKVTTGFAGEVEGHGTPPNRPGWPVTMDGPKMLPVGGTGNYSANVNWAANGSDQLSMVSSQIGSSIHYRWEVFNITTQAKAEAERQAKKAREAKAAIQALMGQGLMPDAAAGQTQTAVRSDVAGKAGGGTGANTQPKTGTTDPTAPPPGKTDEDENKYADEIAARRRAMAGTMGGDDVTGLGGANVEFQREFKNLWGDTKRAWNQVGNSAGSGFFERRSDDMANLTAVGLLPISALVTSLGASLRWSSDFFAGDRQQQEIPMKVPGTYLIRVIVQPREDTDREGNPIIRPSTVATQVVEVVEMERMVREGLNDPGAREAESKKAYQDALNAKAKGKATDDEVAAAKAKYESVSLDVSGDPRVLLQTRIHEKEKEAKAAHDKWDPYGIKGPVIEVEDQLDILKKRLELYDKQDTERRQGADSSTRLTAPGMRITATLASEVTGQPYPLLLSVGPMKSGAGTYKWAVLDATSKKAESFEGESTISARDAIEKALLKFGGDAQYGRGIIGVRLSPEVMKQLDPKDNPEFRIPSQAVGWAIARSRIDDLVMTLVALGLMVASAGTAAAIIGAAVAAAKLIHRLFAGTLEFDAETVSDLLAVLGGAGALVGASAKASQVAAGIRVKKIGELFVMLPESAAVESNLAKATAAFNKAVNLAHKVEMANEALGYAGLVWGNATFLTGMADIAIAEADGKITHAEARRQRATAIGGAIQNNGLFLAGNVKKARDANKAAALAKSGAKGGPTESSVGGGGGSTTASDSTTTTATDPAAGTTGTSGGKHDEPTPKPVTPVDVTAPKEQAGVKDAPPGGPPAPDEALTKGGGATDEGANKASDHPGPVDPAEPTGATEKKPGETTTNSEPPKPHDMPAPGSRKGRAAAKEILDGVANGTKHGPVEDAIKMAGNWKQTLKKAISTFGEGQRAEAEKALVEARDAIVEETWKKVQKEANGRFDGLYLENAGTKSFGSDIDGTIRPAKGTEATETGARMAEQVKLAGEAAAAMSKALRARVGGETDVVIDTNIYSFIGEGRIKPTGEGKAQQQHADIVAGLAEQLRGQGEEQFKAFEKRLLEATKDKTVHKEAKALLEEARKFHDERVKEYNDALKDATADPKNTTPAARVRAAKEHILGQKKQKLGELMGAQNPDVKAITELQAGINWFAPDAYATPSAFKQGVGHGQRLKGTASAAEQMSPKEVATKLREAASKVKPDDPRGAKLKADAELVDSQAQLLDATLREHRQLVAEAPMNAKKVSQLEERAARLRDSIADKANALMIAELMQETAPSDRPSADRLIESAAASGANQGMLEDHVRHAGDIDGMVKAAAKYAGRIAMAEFLSGLRPSTSAVGRLVAEFVKGRWGIMEDVSSGIMRDMFIRFAELKGLKTELKFNDAGQAIGATDSLKQAFVHEVREWAKKTNDGIQIAAIGSKAYDSPAPAVLAAEAASRGGAPGGGSTPEAGGGAGSGGGTGGGGGPTNSGGGGSQPPPSSGGATPAPSSDRPTIPVASGPEDNGPATVKYPKASVEDNGPATKRDGGAGPAGGIVVEPRDGIAIRVHAKDHPNDLVRLVVVGNTIQLTDIYRRATDSPVTGSMLLTAALKEAEVVSGNELLITGIINPETLDAYHQGVAPDQSKLGRTAARGLEGAGLSAGPMRWEHDGEKLQLGIKIK